MDLDPFIYNFVCGGVIFVFGLVLAWRQGSLGLSGRGRRNLCLAVGVFGFYFILQAFLQYKAPGMPAAEPAAYRPTPASEAAEVKPVTLNARSSRSGSVVLSMEVGSASTSRSCCSTPGSMGT